MNAREGVCIRNIIGYGLLWYLIMFSFFFDAEIPEKMGPPTIKPAAVSVPPYSDQTLPGV